MCNLPLLLVTLLVQMFLGIRTLHSLNMPLHIANSLIRRAATLIPSPDVGATSSRATPILVNLHGEDRDYRPRVVFILGGPGAGKGTQCEMLSEEYGMKHLSAGELLRQERLSGSANGNLIESYIQDGKIVPVHITLDLLRSAMNSSGFNRFLIDGFPRNFDNVLGWEKHMNDVVFETIFFIECPEEELERRLISRGLSSGRSDDNPDTARKRFVTFKAETMPVVEHFKTLNKVIILKGDKSKFEVFDELKIAMNPFIAEELIGLTRQLINAIEAKNPEAYSKFFAAQSPPPPFERESTDVVLSSLAGPAAVSIDQIETMAVTGSTSSPSSGSSSSVLQSFSVDVRGKTADVSYARHFTSSIGGLHVSVDESRSWALENGQWVHVGVKRGQPSLSRNKA